MNVSRSPPPFQALTTSWYLPVPGIVNRGMKFWKAKFNDLDIQVFYRYFFFIDNSTLPTQQSLLFFYLMELVVMSTSPPPPYLQKIRQSLLAAAEVRT